MNLVWASAAAEEWTEQYRFYFARNPAAARRMRERVMERAGQLRQFPRMGKPGRVDGSRELVIPGTPFVLVYDENPARVEILHVHDTRQNFEESEE